MQVSEVLVSTVKICGVIVVSTYNGKKDYDVVNPEAASQAASRVPSKGDDCSSKHCACYSWAQCLPSDFLSTKAC